MIKEKNPEKEVKPFCVIVSYPINALITHQVVEVNLGAGSDRLGGTCDRYNDDNLLISDSYGGFCDGPLKAKTFYRYHTHSNSLFQSYVYLWEDSP